MSRPELEDTRPSAIGDVGRVPEDDGWALWDEGRCSITRCLERPVAAIERVARQRRPAHWQSYCEEHARARGVERRDGELVFTAAFLTPSRRQQQVERARRDSNP